jgi:hypothetical protein
MPDFKISFSSIDARAQTEFDPTDPTGQAKRLVPAFNNLGDPTDLLSLTVPLANDRTSKLFKSVGNQYKVLNASNGRIGALNFAMQELQRISPTGQEDKQAKTEIPGQAINGTISSQAWETLKSVKDASNKAVTDMFVATTSADGKTVTISKMQANNTFNQVTTIMKSAVDQASQNNQLEMTNLQGLTNKYNQSIETLSDLVSKFADIGSKLVGNFRPLR